MVELSNKRWFFQFRHFPLGSDFMKKPQWQLTCISISRPRLIGNTHQQQYDKGKPKKAAVDNHS